VGSEMCIRDSAYTDAYAYADAHADAYADTHYDAISQQAGDRWVLRHGR